MDLKSLIRNPSKAVIPTLPFGIEVDPKLTSARETPHPLNRPEQTMFEKMLVGTLNPYTFFPYTTGRKYVVVKRWSDYFEKEYRRTFIQDCKDTFVKFNYEAGSGVTLDHLTRALKKEQTIPTPFQKGAGATFFLSTVASHLYSFLDPDILLKSKEEREVYKQRGILWQKKWFEGLFKDSNAMKEKTPAVVKFISECMPFRPAPKATTKYLLSKGAMPFEEYYALQEQEALDEFLQWEFALIMQMYAVALEQRQQKRNEEDTKKAEEVYHKLCTTFLYECENNVDRLMASTDKPLFISFLKLVRLGLKEYILDIKPNEVELATAVSDIVMLFADKPLHTDLDTILQTELGNLKQSLGLYFTFVTTGTLSRYGDYMKSELLMLFEKIKLENEEQPDPEEDTEQQPKEKEEMPTSIHLNQELLARLDQVSNSQNVSRSEIIRQSLEKTLDAQPVETFQKQYEQVKAELEKTKQLVEELRTRPSEQASEKPFVLNGVEFYLDKGSKGSIRANGVNLVGMSLPSSDMLVTITSLNSLELSRP